MLRDMWKVGPHELFDHTGLLSYSPKEVTHVASCRELQGK